MVDRCSASRDAQPALAAGGPLYVAGASLTTFSFTSSTGALMQQSSASLANGAVSLAIDAMGHALYIGLGDGSVQACSLATPGTPVALGVAVPGQGAHCTSPSAARIAWSRWRAALTSSDAPIADGRHGGGRAV